MNEVKKQKKKRFSIMLIMLSFIFALFSFNFSNIKTSADESQVVYSSVLDDLEKDENFNAEDIQL